MQQPQKLVLAQKFSCLFKNWEIFPISSCGWSFTMVTEASVQKEQTKTNNSLDSIANMFWWNKLSNVLHNQKKSSHLMLPHLQIVSFINSKPLSYGSHHTRWKPPKLNSILWQYHTLANGCHLRCKPAWSHKIFRLQLAFSSKLFGLKFQCNEFLNFRCLRHRWTIRFQAFC